MEKRGVVRKVEEPTDLVNSIAIVKKHSGSLLICLDPRYLNKAIKRENFQLTTIEDITTSRANAKWFTNLTLNKEKCIFKVKEITYIGHKLTQEGIKPDDEKVRAINDMPAPTNKNGVERLLGTVNYLGKFIPNLAAVTEPIRGLLRKDIEFQWSHEQDKALQEIKSILTKDGGPVLTFFNEKTTTTITISCDASPIGLRWVLLQDRRPVAYALRSLSDSESRYAQIAKELLAVHFSLERFNQYPYGKRVTIESII